MCLADIQHSLDKVLTIQPKHPSNADNEILLQCLADCQLTFQLCLTVYIQRLIILAIWLPGLCALTIKHIVRADIGHLTIQFLAYICNILRAARIDSTDFCHFIVILCHIHSSPCCTVNYSIRIYFCNNFLNSIFVGNVLCYIRCFCYRRTICYTAVVFLNIRTNTFMTALQQLIHHIMAQLTANACYKKLHVLSSSGF